MNTLTLTAAEIKTLAQSLELSKQKAFDAGDTDGCVAAMLLVLKLRKLDSADAPKASSITTVDFSERRYIASHGKAPRGRGLWLFELTTGELVFEFNGTLTAAKAAARRHMRETCKRTGKRTLFICP